MALDTSIRSDCYAIIYTFRCAHKNKTIVSFLFQLFNVPHIDPFLIIKSLPHSWSLFSISPLYSWTPAMAGRQQSVLDTGRPDKVRLSLIQLLSSLSAAMFRVCKITMRHFYPGSADWPGIFSGLTQEVVNVKNFWNGVAVPVVKYVSPSRRRGTWWATALCVRPSLTLSLGNHIPPGRRWLRVWHISVWNADVKWIFERRQPG